MQAMKAIAPATGAVGPITAVGRKLSRVSSLRVRNAAASAVYSTTSTTDKFLNQVKSVPKNIEYGGGGGGGGLQPKGPTQSFSKASDVSANVTSPPSGASLDSTSEIPTDTPSGIGGGDKEGSGAGPNKVTFEMSSSNSSSSFGSEDEMEEYFPSSAKASQESRQEQQQQTIINTFLNQRTSYPGMVMLCIYFLTYTAKSIISKFCLQCKYYLLVLPSMYYRAKAVG